MLRSHASVRSTRSLGRLAVPLLIVFWAVSLILVSGAAADVLDVTWSAPTVNEDGTPLQDLAGYRVYYGTATTTATEPPCNGTVVDAAKATSHHLTGLNPGGTYYVRVTAYDASGNESACSVQASAIARAETANLYVVKAGAGSGTVTSSPAGISCGTDCGEAYAVNTRVTLTATAASGSTFAGWTGACSGTAACVITMGQAQTVTGTFNATTAALTVTKAGTGSGTVTSSPAGISCGTDCSESYNSSTSVRLTAAADSGSTFAGWGAPCTGTGTCTASMTQARTITATFNTVSAQGVPLTVTTTGTGSGTVTSSPAGISCGTDCSETYAANTNVTLTPVAADGSTFAGWSGACAGTAACTVVMSQARSATATFAAGLAGDGQTIWGPSAVPAVASDADTAAVEIGLKFRAATSGFITGIRFYKSTQNTGVHDGHLWTSTGTLLATVTFTNESASGWQQAKFSNPVAIAANTTYIASYHTNVGHYAGDSGYFARSGISNGYLTALANGAEGGNGVYRYGASGGFPSQTWDSSNYWVDVVFTPSAQTTDYTLTVGKSGAGVGTVTSSPAGIACGVDCSEAYALNTNVTLTPVAAAGSTFAGWTGVCAGTTNCTIVMSQARAVTAIFNPASTQAATLGVTKAGTGSGNITSSPAGINCGTDCSESYALNTTVTLSPAAASGSTFAGWTGACSGTGNCTVTMSGAKTVTANFRRSWRR